MSARLHSESSRDPDTAFELRPVLASAPLTSGRVGEARWDLSSALMRANATRRMASARFDTLAVDVARPMREYLYARLNVDLPGEQLRIPPSGLQAHFQRARRFLLFIAARLGACDLARVDQALLDAYLADLQSGGRSRHQVAHYLDAVIGFHRYRRHMPSGGMPLKPWRGRAPHTIAGARSIPGENRTPRMPEDIIEPLLAWSIKYVKVFAPDILAARDEWDRLGAQSEILIREDNAPGVDRMTRRRARFAAFLAQRARDGRGIPVWSMPLNRATRRPGYAINRALIERSIAWSPLNAMLERRLRAALMRSGPELGGMDTPISIDLDTGKPWRARFDIATLKIEERMLQTAIYIVCSYLTGMRDSEVQAMRAGCCRASRSEDGVITRYRIRSLTYKGRRAAPQQADWITIAPVAEAIDILHSLTARIRAGDDDDNLWRNLHPHPTSEPHIASAIVKRLNDFSDHLNVAFGTPAVPVIPLGQHGKPWRITTRQFRRTIAWHIANRPFGAVAGMIQYKHASVAAFEGYAGSSPSGFRAEIAREHALGQLEDILTYFNTHRDGLSISGPASTRVKQSLGAVAAELSSPSAAVADRGRLRVLLKDLARTLHVGPLADCFFDPAHALCLKRATTSEADAPAIALCEPTRCPNACFTARHRAVWAKAQDDAQALLREKRLSAAQRTTLKLDHARYARVVKQIDASSS